MPDEVILEFTQTYARIAVQKTLVNIFASSTPPKTVGKTPGDILTLTITLIPKLESLIEETESL